MPATYQATGPMFDGTAVSVIDYSLTQMTHDGAIEGQRRVRQRLGRVLKHPTGFYESRISVDLSVKDYAVTDSGVVYGPWLEGVSSRNARSRFKGYSTFRKVFQELDADMVTVVQPDTAQMIRKLGG